MPGSVWEMIVFGLNCSDGAVRIISQNVSTLEAVFKIAWLKSIFRYIGMHIDYDNDAMGDNTEAI